MVLRKRWLPRCVICPWNCCLSYSVGNVYHLPEMKSAFMYNCFCQMFILPRFLRPLLLVGSILLLVVKLKFVYLVMSMIEMIVTLTYLKASFFFVYPSEVSHCRNERICHHEVNGNSLLAYAPRIRFLRMILLILSWILVHFKYALEYVWLGEDASV